MPPEQPKTAFCAQRYVYISLRLMYEIRSSQDSLIPEAA